MPPIRQMNTIMMPGYLKKRTIELLYHQLETLVERIREQAEHAEKFLVGEKPTGKAGNYELYYNEVIPGS
jgi:hypothetical protein